MSKKKVYAYYDGSNFYHNAKNAYGITNIQFHHLTNKLLNLNEEELIKIKYFNSPINQEDNPGGYTEQQKFFEKIKTTPFVDLFLGKLVKRKLGRINLDCPKCGRQKANSFKCPKCNRDTSLNYSYKIIEKGIDVHIAISLILDALTDDYDIALLFSGDADFCPAIRYIVKELGKEVIFCHFPTQETEELMQVCSDNRIITKEAVEESRTIN